LRQQQTIAKPVEVSGLGLFTGQPVKVRFKPAAVDTGVQFIRVDTPKPVRIRALVANVAKRARRTSLQNGTASVETIEHCLAALHGLGVDNVEIELEGGELPGCDGSSRAFVSAINDAGIITQDRLLDPLIITDVVRVADGDAELIAAPGDDDSLNIIYDLDYGNSGLLHRQLFAVRLTKESFSLEIADARTYVFESEAQQLRDAGLGKHLTPKDVVVIGPNGVIDNEFRFPDECVRHKVLDLIGDLLLAGRAIYGKIYAHKSGHALNHELVRKLIKAIEAKQAAQTLSREAVLDVRRLQRLLPHRFPFLLVDRVVSIDSDQRAVGIKNVSINEDYFQGHFPGHPIMPGVLILEAMAQLSGILLSQKLEHTGKVAMLLSMDHVKFRRPVVPGDQLVLEAHTLNVKTRTGHVQCYARVAGELAAQAEIKFMMVDAEPL